MYVIKLLFIKNKEQAVFNKSDDLNHGIVISDDNKTILFSKVQIK